MRWFALFDNVSGIAVVRGFNAFYSAFARGNSVRSITSCWSTVAIMATLACTAVPGMAAVITVTTTIQDAVNAAQPGDRIVVPPGTYHESVDVTTNNLSIVGSRGAVLDAGGFTNGIHVGGDA